MFHGLDGGGFMWLGILFWIVLFIVVIWIVITVIKKNKITGSGFPDTETPVDIIKKRYAKGEITKEQFEEMKKSLL